MPYKLRNVPGFRKYQTPLEPLPKGVANGSRCARVEKLQNTGLVDTGICILSVNAQRTGPLFTGITWGLNITRYELELKTEELTKYLECYVFVGIGARAEFGAVDLFERRL